MHVPAFASVEHRHSDVYFSIAALAHKHTDLADGAQLALDREANNRTGRTMLARARS